MSDKYYDADGRAEYGDEDRANDSVNASSGAAQRGRDVADGNKRKVGRVLLGVVNQVFAEQEFASKAILSCGEFDRFRARVWEILANSIERDENSGPVALHDFVVECFQDDDKTYEEGSDDEENFETLLRERFSFAGGVVIGELFTWRKRQEMYKKGFGTKEFFEEARKERPDLYAPAVPKPAPAPTPVAKSAARPLSAPPRVLSAAPTRVGFSSLEEYRSARSAAEGAREAKPWDSVSKPIARIFLRYFDGGKLEAADYVRFLRLAAVRFFTGTILSGADPDEKLWNLLTSSDAGSDPNQHALQTLVERIVGERPELKEGVVAEDFEDVFSLLNDSFALANRPVELLNGIALTVVKAVGKALGCDPEQSDRSFDQEFIAIARCTLKERFANWLFSPDYSDFNDFRTAFEDIGGRGAKLPEGRLRRVFAQAGGQMNEEPVDEDADSDERSQWTQSRGELIKKLVAEEFGGVFDPESPEAYDKFRKLGEEYGVEFFTTPENDKLRSMIQRCSVVCDGKFYSISDQYKKRIKESIEAIFRVGASLIFFKSYYEKSRSWLEEIGIPNVRVLRALLAGWFPKFVFYGAYFEEKKSFEQEVIKVRDEILRVWGTAEVQKVEELAGWIYVTPERIKAALDVLSDEFKKKGDGYAQATDDFDYSSVSRIKALDKEFGERCKEFEEKDGLSLPAASYGLPGKQFLVVMNDPAAASVVAPAQEEPVSEPQPEKDSWALKAAKLREEDAESEPGEDEAESEPEEAEEPEEEESVEAPAAPQTLFDAAKVAEAEEPAAEEEEEEPAEEPEPAPRPTRKRAKKAAPKKPAFDREESKRRAPVIARVLSSFKEGFDIDNPNDLAKFRAATLKKGLELSDDDSEAIDEIARVGFVEEGRVYIVSRKTREELEQVVNDWFDNEGALIFYDAFFEREEEWLAESGLPTVAALKNRLMKYFPDFTFYEDYFEREEDDRPVEDKVRDEILRVWKGATSRRIGDLVGALYISRETLGEFMANDHDSFVVSSNGYWKLVQKPVQKTPVRKKAPTRRLGIRRK